MMISHDQKKSKLCQWILKCSFPFFSFNRFPLQMPKIMLTSIELPSSPNRSQKQSPHLALGLILSLKPEVALRWSHALRRWHSLILPNQSVDAIDVGPNAQKRQASMRVGTSRNACSLPIVFLLPLFVYLELFIDSGKNLSASLLWWNLCISYDHSPLPTSLCLRTGACWRTLTIVKERSIHCLWADLTVRLLKIFLCEY